MKKNQIILGLNTGHGDSSAALIIDNNLVAAAEEERFSRIKHDASFPIGAIQYCLKHAGIGPQKVTDIAIPRNPHLSLSTAFKNGVKNPIDFGKKLWNVAKNTKSQELLSSISAAGLSNARIHRIEHHHAHLMSVVPVLGYQDASMLSIDGMGDGVSAVLARWSGDKLNIVQRVYSPQSIGYFYTAVTMFLGFPNFGDEFKVMGLSSLGKPIFIEKMRELIATNSETLYELNRKVFSIALNDRLLEITNRIPRVINLYSTKELESILGVPPRKVGAPIEAVHADIAASLQLRFEEVANSLLQHLHNVVPGSKLGLAGGCSHNSVWVGKIPQNSPFSEIYVAPASGDAGLAVGAAVAVCEQHLQISNKHPALLGPDCDEVRAKKFNSTDSRLKERTFSDESELLTWIVEQITLEKVIGVFRGRMEFGPRALGSRSIICDPRSVSMRDQLNARVKHREAFRPFAAFIMFEHQNEWLEHSFYAPTMEAVFKVRPEKRSLVPAVVHYDQSCRIQSVRKDVQTFIWSLLERYYIKTGVPLLINTSFNDSEPVVCTEDDALSCFLHCDMDYVVFDNRVVSKGTV